ncbi:Predicted DNA-binding transcriptional regulator YafY, contains an HTH and WYL domains [Lentzea xinjiangensis]|uniref:Predicted DNA-binding transcriptional regulator YafY, contains an HTH and WYL domains n=1 Tax=Lentzea xinjiangensis TaxID=402600 RepID=A0A1H9L416_9PSEU|nr:Predicted DNA-binding transcriptional regulator YafY, contains an HTH and WYL domains [Lentzea xinjiangensis]
MSLLLLLQTKGRMTARALADELEVSVRTIYRDVESLHAAGVPLYGDAGPQGGYQLLDGYRTKLTGLTEQEAESLFLAGLPGPAADLGFGEAVSAAQLKLMAALPSPMRDKAERMATRFHLDAPAWYYDPERSPLLEPVADAVWRERLLEVTYRRWQAPEEVTRVLRPLGLVLKAGRWYLVALGASRISTYRVSQIQAATVLDEPFTRPAGFDLAAHWAASLEDFQARQHTGEAVIRLSPRGWESFSSHVLPVVAKAAEESAVHEGGRVRVTIPIESIGHATGMVLRMGGEAEVLAPDELRERVTAVVRELAAIYLSQVGPQLHTGGGGDP